MINYNQSINIPSFDYCYGIAKLLDLITSKYSTQDIKQLILNKNFLHPQSTLIDIHSILQTQVSKGLIKSNELINTPYKNPILIYKLEKSLARIVTFKEEDHSSNLLSCSLDPNLKWEYPSDNDRFLYSYAYFLRMGYTIDENLGKSYFITEPLGLRYSIDNYSCSCTDGINNKKCLHLQLIDWYRKSKLYKHYANRIARVNL